MQKLLSMDFLPSFCPVRGCAYSQVQCGVAMTWPAASVWQPRQARVTASPLANGPSRASNFE
jgi:hypothetical protein